MQEGTALQGERKHFATYFHLQEKCKKPLWKERAGFESGEFRTSTPHTFYFPKKFLWLKPQLEFSVSHSVGCSWVYRWGSWLIRSCGRGNTPAWTELTWAHRGLGKQCPEACRGWLLEQWHPQNWLNKSSLQGWPGCEEMPWDSIVPQAWALSETAKENDCYLQCNELAGQKHFLNIFWPF